MHCYKSVHFSVWPTHGKAVIGEGSPRLVLLVHFVLGIHKVLHIIQCLEVGRDCA